MSRTAELVVRLAARLLPSPMRETYREQWLADLRDAPELELRPSEIAAGSLAFALAAPRTRDARRRSPNVVGRSRLASALALSAAVLCMSDQLGAGSQSLTSNDLYNLIVFLGTAFLYLYMLVAPIAAAILVTVTRGVPARIRVAVALFIIASLAGAAHAGLNGIRRSAPLGTIALVEDVALFAAAAVLLGAGCALIARRTMPPTISTRSPLVGLVSVVIALLTLGLGLANVLSLRAQLHAADTKFVQDVLVANHTADAMAMLAQSNQATIAAIAVWGVTALIASIAVGWLAYLRPQHAVARGLALLFAMMISHAALLTFVWLNSFGGPGVHLTVPEAVLLVVGRWGLVAVILYAVGGLRLARVRHRHDVEGAVELL
jgi:hypothetical protein